MARAEMREDRPATPDSRADPGPLQEECQQFEGMRDRLSRLAAEFANYRRRTERESLERQNHGKAAVLIDLLEVADDLERALHAAEADSGSLREGVAGIYRRLRRLLAKHQVEPLKCLGEPFDPDFHEALATVPANGVPPDHIAKEQQRGYLHNGKLLRPARVVVAKEMTLAEEGSFCDSNG